MALRGHHIYPSSRKRKAAAVTLGRCDICDVDFTSQTQKESHIAGRKHCKNVRLVDAGQPVEYFYVFLYISLHSI